MCKTWVQCSQVPEASFSSESGNMKVIHNAEEECGKISRGCVATRVWIRLIDWRHNGSIGHIGHIGSRGSSEIPLYSSQYYYKSIILALTKTAILFDLTANKKNVFCSFVCWYLVPDLTWPNLNSNLSDLLMHWDPIVISDARSRYSA